MMRSSPLHLYYGRRAEKKTRGGVKVAATRPDDRSPVPRTHMVGGEKTPSGSHTQTHDIKRECDKEPWC